MVTGTSRVGFVPPARTGRYGEGFPVSTDIARRALAATEQLLAYSGYGIIFAAYGVVLAVAIATLSLIEIRQANLRNSNALIAMLEEKDRYGRDYLEGLLKDLAKDIQKYDQSLRRAGLCPDRQASAGSKEQGQGPIADVQAGAPDENDVEPKNCDEFRTIADRHYVELLSIQDRLQLREANLPKYYDAYFDGLREKTPQLVPLLRYMDAARHPWLTAWARLPLELHEMVLLICMGVLGGVISVTRCFVDGSAPPRARDLCYRPVAGAVIALGIYVLFRATQLFFGGGSQEATTVSTSVFVLAALGLASGISAREAVTKIEEVAAQLLRRVQEGGEKRGE
jgi:hypothetical protein